MTPQLNDVKLNGSYDVPFTTNAPLCHQQKHQLQWFKLRLFIIIDQLFTQHGFNGTVCVNENRSGNVWRF